MHLNFNETFKKHSVTSKVSMVVTRRYVWNIATVAETSRLLQHEQQKQI